jgi:hypothetical protein
VSVFQGCRSGVTQQLKEHDAPFMLGMHCMAHRTNLAVEPLSNLPVVSKLETLCQELYTYFSMSAKKHLEFQRLADIVETEGLRMLRNVKTRWISLLEPLRRVMGEYKTLIVKMCEDAAVKEPALTPKQAASRESARHNCDLLCDIGTLLALPCVLPLLECVNDLMKFAQSRDVFISDYVAAVKICQADLYMMYVDSETSFQKAHFHMFCDVVEDHSYTISQEWVTDLNTGAESLAFRISGHTYPAHILCPTFGRKLSVSRADFDGVVASVKGQCRDAAELLIGELEKRFPVSDLMNSLAIVFPQFWLQSNSDELFGLHMKTLRGHFGVVRHFNRGSKEEPQMVQVDPILDARTLGYQTSLFKLTMKSNSKGAMEEPRDRNPLTKLWQKVSQNTLMTQRLSEFIKVAEIAVTAVLGSVEDERTFSTLAFMKSKLRNRLGSHLDTAVKMFSQPFYNQESFPYSLALTHWRQQRTRLGADQ